MWRVCSGAHAQRVAIRWCAFGANRSKREARCLQLHRVVGLTRGAQSRSVPLSCHKETFGPILSIFRVKNNSDEEALARFASQLCVFVRVAGVALGSAGSVVNASRRTMSRVRVEGGLVQAVESGLSSARRRTTHVGQQHGHLLDSSRLSRRCCCAAPAVRFRPGHPDRQQLLLRVELLRALGGPPSARVGRAGLGEGLQLAGVSCAFRRQTWSAHIVVRRRHVHPAEKRLARRLGWMSSQTLGCNLRRTASTSACRGAILHLACTRQEQRFV